MSDTPKQTDEVATNYLAVGFWSLCLHCRNVYEFESAHFCGAPWQTPDTRPFPYGIPQEWVDEIRARSDGESHGESR